MILSAKRDFMQTKIGCDFFVDSSFRLHWASLNFENRLKDRSVFQRHCIIPPHPALHDINIIFIFIKDGRPYLFHSFRNKYFDKISFGNMLYFQNKL